MRPLPVPTGGKALLLVSACAAAGAAGLMAVQAMAGNFTDMPQHVGPVYEQAADIPSQQVIPPVSEDCGTQFQPSDFGGQPDDNVDDLIRLQMEEAARRKQEEDQARDEEYVQKQRQEEEGDMEDYFAEARRLKEYRDQEARDRLKLENEPAPASDIVVTHDTLFIHSSRSSSSSSSFTLRKRECGRPRGLSQLFGEGDAFCGYPGWTFPGLWGGDCPITLCIIKFGKGDGISGDQDFQ